MGITTTTNGSDGAATEPTGAAQAETDGRRGPLRPVRGEVRHFRWWLLVLVLIGFAVRLAAVLVVGSEAPFEHGDAGYYHGQAQAIVEGAPFVNPLAYIGSGLRLPDASHPPLYSLVLASTGVVGSDSMLAHQMVDLAIGTGSIVAIALLGRRLGGERTGLVAAALATLYPAIWAHEALVLSEVLIVLLVPVVLLAVYSFRDHPTTGRAAAVSALVALLALTRSEFIFLAPALVLPLLWSRTSGAARLKALGAGAGVGLVLIGPWVGWNMTRFEEPVYLSHQFGQTLAAANCEKPYYETERLGYIDYDCIDDGAVPGETRDEADARYNPPAVDAANQERALEYAGDNLGRVPVVVAARMGRAWEIYSPSNQIELHEAVQNRPGFVAWSTVYLTYPLVALAVVGVLVLRRRGEVVWPLLVFAAITTAVAALTFGSVRYRAGSDVVLITLAAAALSELWGTARDPARGRTASRPSSSPRPAR